MLVSQAEWEAIENSPYSKLFQHDHKGKLGSVFGEDFNTTGWIGLNVKALTLTAGSSQARDRSLKVTATYKPVVSYDRLLRTVLHLKIAALRLKPENKRKFRFKYVNDLGIKIAPSATFGSDKQMVARLDIYSHLVLHSRMIPEGERAIANEELGNIDELTEWSYDSIEATEIFPRQMWYYSWWDCKGVPLREFSDPTSIYHSYELSLQVGKFLIVQQFDKAQMKWVKYKLSEDMNIFDDPQLAFDIPNMYGLFGNISPPEIEEWDKLEKPIRYYVFDMINCDPDDRKKYVAGETAIAKLNKCKGITQCLFWSLENVTYEGDGITCNYTKDCSTMGKGIIPIESNEIITSAGPKFNEEMPSALFSGSLCAGHCMGMPLRKGILTMPYVTKIERGNNGGATPQSLESVLSCTLRKDCPEGSSYMLRVRALVAREMIIADGVVKITPH